MKLLVDVVHEPHTKLKKSAKSAHFKGLCLSSLLSNMWSMLFSKWQYNKHSDNTFNELLDIILGNLFTI